MKLIEVVAVIVVLLICTLCYFIVSMYAGSNTIGEDGVILLNSAEFSKSDAQTREDETPEVVLALVICGNNSERVAQAITMLKSVILMGQRTKLRVIAFVDAQSRPLLSKKIDYLSLQGEALESRVSIELTSTWFPKDGLSDWSQVYSPCSTQRLFFPSLLPTTDALIYLDTDVLVLDDLELLWNHFNLMGESQIFGMAPEHELPGDGWYNTKANFPFYGPRGVNAGIMLMNLTRMRSAHFEHRASDIFKEYREKLRWGDQDILNIYLHSHPEHSYLLPCEWNYRMNHCDCEYGGGDCKCKGAEVKGAAIFHGNKGNFLTASKYPFANSFYEAYNKYDLLHGSPKDLIEELVKALSLKSSVNCKRLKSILMRRIRDQFDDKENELFLDFSSGS